MASDGSHRPKMTPFAQEYRASGLLLHVTSLPSHYGIGDLGPQAFAWIDRLHDAGQTWWQALPLGPTGYGNSPYQPLSSFAGNVLLVSPELLIADGLLEPGDCVAESVPGPVDYDSVIPFKERLLEIAFYRFGRAKPKNLLYEFEQFCFEEAPWLEDYALFSALKARHGGISYLEWPADLVERRPKALAEAQRDLRNVIDQVRFAQFLQYRQGEMLKKYARSKGVNLIGDLPFFVSPDSSDVWAHPELFVLDERRRPKFVAGVPPDYFSADGQLWGNPVYDWEALRATGYRWCIDRCRALLSHVDLIRLDHFRGFAASWNIPAGAPTARSGSWEAGPGAEFLETIEAELGGLPFIAEDLGLITADVEALRDHFHIPGTRVLQFAFDGHEDNPHLPQNAANNTVMYTGTHDNLTSREWFEQLTDSQRRLLLNKYFRNAGSGSIESGPALMSLAWQSRAALAMAPLQDLLNLGGEARMNVPGRAGGNWGWRCSEAMFTDEPFAWLRDLTARSKRLIQGETLVAARRNAAST